MSQSMTDYTTKLGRTGGQLANLGPVQDDMNKILELMLSMTNMQDGFDATRVMNTYFKILSLQASMATKALQFSVLHGAFSDYMTMMSKMTSANLQLVSNMSNSCVPTSKAAAEQAKP